MKKVVESEGEMRKFGEEFAKGLELPAVVELRGDVGAGKTTFTRGLAKGLGVEETVVSPSFTISKRYRFPGGELVHYDFYRLEEPGIMAEELAETLEEKDAVVVVELAGEVEGLLPEKRNVVKITTLTEERREISVE